MTLPDSLRIDAWTGDRAASAAVGSNAIRWGVQPHAMPVSRTLAADEPPDMRLWADDKVGWGLLLPENEGISEADRARATDAPEPIQALLASRPGSAVFRWRADSNHRWIYRYYADRAREVRPIVGAGPRGNGPGRLPYYLLIYGGPNEIPWSAQYVLSQPCFVGRLHLKGEALERYVTTLMAGWPGSACQPDHPVVWAADDGSGDITELMRKVIAEPIHQELSADSQIGANASLDTGAQATIDRLKSQLSQQRPALVVSTSHGLTAPLAPAGAMAGQLGVPVDSAHKVLDPGDLLAAWEPDGAIWYAHACCSAGSDSRNSYSDLVPAASPVGQILTAVAAVGPTISPLPTALLSAKKPLRAFVGHVEPTFDWTLRAPENGAELTDSIVEAMYRRLFRAKPEPISMALNRTYRHVGELLAQHAQALKDIALNLPGSRVAAVRLQLTALDRQSMVVLGDPTVALPPLPGN
jgi:hypothetical protein